MRSAPSLLAVLAALLFGLQGAQEAKAEFTYQVPGLSQQPNLLGGFTVKLDGTSYGNALVGGIKLSQKFSPTGVPLGVPDYGNFTTVCLDLKGSLLLGSSYSFYREQFEGQIGLNPNWGASYPPVNGDEAYLAIQNAAHLYKTVSPGSAEQWAGLQLAVWSAIYNTDSGGEVTGVRFSVTGGNATAIDYANGLIRDLNRGEVEYAGYLLKPLNASAQELLVGVTEVPEPSTMLAAALLLLPFGASAFRVLRKRNANK